MFLGNIMEIPSNVDSKDSLNPLSTISAPTDLIKRIDMCIPPNLGITSTNCSGYSSLRSLQSYTTETVKIWTFSVVSQMDFDKVVIIVFGSEGIISMSGL